MSTDPHRWRRNNPEEPPDLQILVIVALAWALYVTWLVIAVRLLNPESELLYDALPERCVPQWTSSTAVCLTSAPTTRTRV